MTTMTTRSPPLTAPAVTMTTATDPSLLPVAMDPADATTTTTTTTLMAPSLAVTTTATYVIKTPPPLDWVLELTLKSGILEP